MRETRAYRVACVLLLVVLFAGQSASATSIDPGFDLMKALPGTQWDFFDTPIPADFFGPGTDPFIEVVPFEGIPFGPGDTDTIIERLDGIAPFEPPAGEATIPIEIIELQLVSSSPIIVTSHGGLDPEPWWVKMEILPIEPQPGSMTVKHLDPNGGDFSTEFLLQPNFTFSEDLDFTPGDLMFQGAPIDFDGTEASWLHPGPPNDQHTPALPSGGFHAPDLDPIPWYGIHPIDPGSESQFLYAAAAPEPATLLLCCAGLAVLLRRPTRCRCLS